jgi:hypothetical protein
MCNLGTETTLVVPARWSCGRMTHAQAVAEVDNLARMLVNGIAALSGVYLRICDTIRQSGLTDDEIRDGLGKHFPPQRVSEFIRIARAPDEVYRRYRAGFVGFRATLSECRGYRLHSDDWLKRRKIRRTAERLIGLMGQGSVEVCGRQVTVA